VPLLVEMTNFMIACRIAFDFGAARTIFRISPASRFGDGAERTKGGADIPPKPDGRECTPCRSERHGYRDARQRG
jgi:hypothetical protein